MQKLSLAFRAETGRTALGEHGKGIAILAREPARPVGLKHFSDWCRPKPQLPTGFFLKKNPYSQLSLSPHYSLELTQNQNTYLAPEFGKRPI
jgi:hypothetical protein